MILVDTSIWIDHFRSTDLALSRALQDGRVLVHPFVLGELALGMIAVRDVALTYLSQLPAPPTAAPAEILDLIERRRLHGSGIGYVDVHLLASTLLSPGARLWTHDRRLADLAEAFGVAPTPL
jgi:predicted nucleic acid-binding protein